MEPFEQGYHTDSGDEATEKFQWPSSNVSASLSARHAALMRDELEVSPLVPIVPPMPGERAEIVPGIPASFKPSAQDQGHHFVALKKRKVGDIDVFEKEDFATEPLTGEQMEGGALMGQDTRVAAVQEVSVDAQSDGLKRKALDSPHEGGNVAQDPSEKKLKTNASVDEEPGEGTLRRPNIRDIVLGNASASKHREKSEPSVQEPLESVDVARMDEEAAPDVLEIEGTDLQSKDTPSTPPKIQQIKTEKRKAAPRSAKKVLVARKEKEQAFALLRDKNDLLDCLDKVDCEFLGTELWIFTVEQLASILLSSTAENQSQSEVNGALDPSQNADIDGATKASHSSAGVIAPKQNVIASAVASSQGSNNVESDEPNKGLTCTGAVEPSQGVPSDGAVESNQDVTNAGAVEPNQDIVANFIEPNLSVSAGTVNPSLSVSNEVLNPSTSIDGANKPSLGAGGVVVELNQDVSNGANHSSQAESTLSYRDQLISKMISSGFLHSQGGMEASVGNSETPDLDRFAAETRLIEWKERLEIYMNDKSKRSLIDDRFPLDGPISCLIPKATQNFFASVPLSKLSVFLSMKKTETGAICDMLKFWRRKCQLSSLSLLGLAKHLLGVSTRIEWALSAIPFVRPRDREWMSDAMIVLTGAAREFLVENQGILTAKRFVDVRTKNLATNLQVWRYVHNLPPLKGSGKVAMVSSWKATAREAIDAEAESGSVLTDVDLHELASKDGDIINEGKMSLEPDAESVDSAGVVVKQDETTETTQDTAASERQLKYALDAPLFLEDVLGKTIAAILASCNVKSASDLFEVSGHDARRAKLYEIVRSHGVAKDNIGCKTILKSWCDKLDKELNQFRPFAREKKKRNRNRGTKVVTVSKVHGGQERSEERYESITPVRITDPFESLSSITQNFLRSIGIVRAEEFLSSRTTDIAEAFVKWRTEVGMPVLKGQGAIASVSGWKAGCRKAAQALGMEKLVSLEPEGRAPVTKIEKLPATRAGTKETKHQSRALQRTPSFMVPNIQKERGYNICRTYLLGGQNLQKFAVASFADPKMQHHFQVQLRQLNKSTTPGLYLTYNGGVRGIDNSSAVCNATVQCTSDHESCFDLPIMQDVAREGRPIRESVFSSVVAGAGVIELSKYGVRPAKPQVLDVLKVVLKEFVIDGNEKTARTVPSDDGFSNVLVRRHHKLGFQYLFYISSSMEKGQCIEIIFPNINQLLCSKAYACSSFEGRLLLEHAFQLLSLEDVNHILDFLENDLLASVDFPGSIATDVDITELNQRSGARRRLHWAALRLANTNADWQLTTDRIKQFYFGQRTLKTLSHDQLETKLRVAAARSLREEVMHELLHALDFDTICGSKLRAVWCPVLKKSFEAFTDFIMGTYCNVEAPSNLSETISTFASELLDKFDTQSKEDYVFSSPTVGGAHSSLTPADMSVAYQIPLDGSDQLDSECKDEWKIVVVTSREEEALPQTAVVGETQAHLQSAAQHEKSGSGLYYEWYKQLVLQVFCRVLELADSFLSVDEREDFGYSSAAQMISERVREVMDANAKRRTPAVIPPLCLPDVQEVRALHQPHAFQLFLGVVWPVLRRANWRLEMGEAPSDLSFIPPSARERVGSSAKLKLKRDRRRAYLGRESREVGLGELSKMTKRVFVRLVTDEEMKKPTTSLTSSRTAEKALHQYLKSVLTVLEESDQDGPIAAKTIVDAILECFKEMAPRLQHSSSMAPPKDDGAEISGDYGCDFLLRFVMTLPSILRQSDLSMQAMHDSLEVIQNLADFLTSDYKRLLDKSFHPPDEHYTKEEKGSTTGLATRLRILHNCPDKAAKSQSINADNSNDVFTSDLTEIVVDEDKNLLTTYLLRVLEQTIPCRASDQDCLKKYRRIHTGFPGVACRHCLGVYGEGRYFFTSIESLTTAASCLEKHMLKCPAVPAEVKNDIITSKMDHAAERKVLPLGSQQSFFNNLWDRLRSSRIEGKVTGIYIPDSFPDDDPDIERGSDSDDMTDHLAVLEFLSTSNHHKNDKALAEALNLYYNCLEYGGRIFNTPAMPEHFSAEWLIRKAAPWPQWQNKKRMLPG